MQPQAQAPHPVTFQQLSERIKTVVRDNHIGNIKRNPLVLSRGLGQVRNGVRHFNNLLMRPLPNAVRQALGHGVERAEDEFSIISIRKVARQILRHEPQDNEQLNYEQCNTIVRQVFRQSAQARALYQHLNNPINLVGAVLDPLFPQHDPAPRLNPLEVRAENVANHALRVLGVLNHPR